MVFGQSSNSIAQPTVTETSEIRFMHSSSSESRYEWYRLLYLGFGVIEAIKSLNQKNIAAQYAGFIQGRDFEPTFLAILMVAYSISASLRRSWDTENFAI